MLTLIVATDSKNGIGKNNNIPWKSREDMKHFKDTTTGHIILMGCNTFKSLNYTTLPNRKHIIIRNEFRTVDAKILENANLHYITESSMDDFVRNNLSTEMFLIGGGKMYEKFAGLCDRLIHTSIVGDYECDTFFQEITPENWVFDFQSVLSDGSIVRYYHRNK